LRRVTDAERFVHDNEARRSHGEWTDPALGRIRLEQWSAEWFEGSELRKDAAQDGTLVARGRPTFRRGSTSLAEAVVKAEAITAEQA
jgi:hypothetical protein